MPRQGDYYFSLQSPWAYIGHKLFREVASTYDLKVNYRPVVLADLRDRRPAADEASSGAAALPDGRAAALARQAWPEFSSSAGELAVQRAARRWCGDRGDRGWPRSRSISATGLCGGVGRPAKSGRSRDTGQNGRRFRASRQAAGRAFGVRGDQRGLRAKPPGCVGGRRVRITGLCVLRRGILGTGSDRIARRRVEVRPRALSFAGIGSSVKDKEDFIGFEAEQSHDDSDIALEI